ncbi:unnamed protein product [Cuscuta epithymum]|uniref:FBD domain-containing protein n=1 Tax=Cuscuta epithymum TaxID=186058 RepID=A0AAV0CRN6_9ASTE|nr:unnamed protein product [Cuscuta epithymum]
MANHRGSNTASDRISQLPEDVKHLILECLSTWEVARTALLSTQWHHVWLRLGRLVFDWEFGEGLHDRACSNLVKTITNVLFLRSGPVKKFRLQMSETTLQKPDLDLWCLFLSRNGIEKLQLSVRFYENFIHKYTLPLCLFSCPTIKYLELEYVDFLFPVNARLGSIFSGLTSLKFKAVLFNPNATGILLKLPNLEELVFDVCDDIHNFVVSAPKLKSLTFTDCSLVTDWKWFEVHVPVIKTLHFSAYSFGGHHVDGLNVQERLPMALNLQAIELDGLCFFCGKCLPLVIQFLQKCPKLSQLEMYMGVEEWSPSVLENLDRWFGDQDLCKLKKITMKEFRGLIPEMLLIKIILSKSPELEEIIIIEPNDDQLDACAALKITREMNRFPRASPKAQVIFFGN